MNSDKLQELQDNVVLAQAGDTKARNAVIDDTMALGYAILRRKGIPVRPDGSSFADKWRTDIWLGVCDAIRTFDPTKGSWSGHAWRHVWSKIYIARIEDRGPASKKSKLGRHDYNYVFVDHLDDGYDEFSSAEYDLVEDMTLANWQRLFRASVGTLAPREEVVMLGVCNGEGLTELGKQIGVCRERARQIYVESIHKVCEQLGVECRKELTGTRWWCDLTKKSPIKPCSETPTACSSKPKTLGGCK